jgi:inner membrane transporter RhtA
VGLSSGNEEARSPLADRVPPHLYFVGSAIFHYLGPSFAVLLFARVPVPGVAWLRIVSAAVIFAVWRRPWRSFFAAQRATRWYVTGLGVVFALMNYSFYIAIDRLPLGTVAAIEFLGPILLAVAAARTRRNLAALALAITGVYLLTDIRIEGDPAAFAWAFINAVLFTLYIILAHRVSRADPTTSPIDRLGAAMLIASVAIAPLGLAEAIPALTDPIALGAGIGVGVSSSVIPYIFDQLAMARLPRATYALFVALLPATAVVVGIIVLRQIPILIEVLGVGLVIAGVLTHQQTTPHRDVPKTIFTRTKPAVRCGTRRWRPTSNRRE